MALQVTVTGAKVSAFLSRALLILFGIVAVAAYLLNLHLVNTGASAQKITPFQLFVTTYMLGCFIMGWLIDRKQPAHTIALLFLIIAYSMALGPIAVAVASLNEMFPGPYRDQIDSLAKTIAEISWIPGVFVPFFFMPLFFPSGTLLSRRWRIPLAVLTFFMLWFIVTIVLRPWPWIENDIRLVRRSLNGIRGSEVFFDSVQDILNVLAIPLFLLIPVSMFLRYRRAGPLGRTQMQWPMTAIALLLGGMILSTVLPAWATFDVENGYPFTWTLAMLFPVSIGIGILRHNLFDIDIIINRAVVYAILTALIIMLYVLIVGALGGLVQTQTSVLSGIVATGVVAVLFQPLRNRLQVIVNRVLYGERDNPALVLSRLAYHLETTTSPAAVLPNLVHTIATTLKIPYVAIWLPTADESLDVAAEWGQTAEQHEMFSLVYQNETIGYLVVAPRGLHDHFGSGERMLLTTIAALTAATVRAVRLSDELQHSRHRIITAREEERRRIRRDLHDGLGPQLASQTLGLEAVAQLLPNNQAKAISLLRSLQAQAEEAILDVRRLVYDLRPPALDDLGLVDALRQSTSRYESKHLRFSFDVSGSMAQLPAAVETAVFRITQEAITNVVRHAQASRCTVALRQSDTDMTIEIIDNGTGLPERYQTGVGMQAMCERAAELDGQTCIESLPGGGTRVQTRFPLSSYHE